ncbi:MAG: hypothetical protein R2786_00975 [Flavobacteriaceae bacterium]
MKIIKTIILLSLIFCIVSCSNKDDSNEEQQEIPTSKIYKKTELIDGSNSYIVQEIFYESAKIKKLVFNKDNFWVMKTYTVSYTGNEIENIIEAGDYSSPSLEDYEIVNQISKTGNNYIISSDKNIFSLEINFTGDYVNSTKVFETSNPSNIYYQESFTRNSQNQLVSSNSDDFNVSYSNYDSNKEQNPLGNVYFSEFQAYIFILGLKFSEDTPQNAIQSQSSFSYEIEVDLEYDIDGYVTKSNYSFDNASPLQYIHSYIVE